AARLRHGELPVQLGDRRLVPLHALRARGARLDGGGERRGGGGGLLLRVRQLAVEGAALLLAREHAGVTALAFEVKQAAAPERALAADESDAGVRGGEAARVGLAFDEERRRQRRGEVGGKAEGFAQRAGDGGIVDDGCCRQRRRERRHQHGGRTTAGFGCAQRRGERQRIAARRHYHRIGEGGEVEVERPLPAFRRLHLLDEQVRALEAGGGERGEQRLAAALVPPR